MYYFIHNLVIIPYKLSALQFVEYILVKSALMIFNKRTNL